MQKAVVSCSTLLALAWVFCSLKEKRKVKEQKQPVYLDYNATTPVASEVAKAIIPYLRTHYGNPSSAHIYGHKAKEAVATARQHVAHLINSKDEEIIFTSCATESINWALKGVTFGFVQQKSTSSNTNSESKDTNEVCTDKGKIHLITSATEHVAVLEVCKYLKAEGFKITILKVDKYGQVNSEDLKEAIQSDESAAVLVSIMLANNETGTLNRIRELSILAKSVRPDVIFHTDASQAIAKILVNVEELQVDLLTIAGHKLYAPKGIGVLYIRGGVQGRCGSIMSRLLHGASHEFGLRAGTENVALIVGLGEACRIAKRDMKWTMSHLKHCRDQLQSQLLSHIQRLVVDKGLASKLDDVVKINGHPTERLPNTLSIAFSAGNSEMKKLEPIQAEKVLEHIKDDVAASAGAACHSDRVCVSHVLSAMSVPKPFDQGTLRLSVGKMTTEAEILRSSEIIATHIADVISSRR